MAGDKPGCGRLLTNDVNNILAIKVAGLAQEGLFVFVVVFRVIDELGGVAAIGLARDAVGNSPAGKGPSALFHVIFGVVKLPVHAHAHGEQLQQLPSVVLVDGVLVAQAVIQEIDHSRIPGNLQQQAAEVPHPVAP